MQTPFPVDPWLTAISLAYRNRAMIADLVLPRLTPISKQEYQYYQWRQPNYYTLPETRVGRKGDVNEVEFEADRLTDRTEDEALDDVIPFDDIANAAGSVDPVGNAAENLTDLIALGREVRVSGLVHNSNTYPAGHKVQLSGATQWNEAGSKPIDDINAGLDKPLQRPTHMVLGRQAWTGLRSHPDIMKSVNRTAGDRGNARRADVAELFELQDIWVGESFVNTAKKGQTAAFSRVWGKHCSLIYLDPLASTPMSNRITFGWTAQYLERIAGQMEEPKSGMRGSIRVRVGESVKERIVANELGYFIEDCVA